jgi:thymidylate synthase (FAD)
MLLAHLGDDLDIVNDARASFDKSSSEVGKNDVKLIRYLVEHDHISPFRGVVFKFKVKAPLFVCRQWWKHVISSNHSDEQLGWNEKSFRYTEIDDADEFYIPKIFRQQSKINRQSTDNGLSTELNESAIFMYRSICEDSFKVYKSLLSIGVGREQARGVLVPSVYTSWVWTVSLQALLNFVDLRRDDGAQHEIAMYAKAILVLITPIVPETIRIWEDT